MDVAVAKVFANYPPKLRKRLLVVRRMIFEVAKKTQGVGKLQETFRFEGNRCIVFDEGDRVPSAELKICIGMALTYHRKPGQT